MDVSKDISMMDSADLFTAIKVTEMQKDVILWFFDNNLDVLTTPMDQFDSILNGMSCLRILLSKYGPLYSVQQWCQYWISWQQTVVERYVAQCMSCFGFYSSDEKALNIIFKVNLILKKSLDLEVLKVSPLAEFAKELEIRHVESEDEQDEQEDNAIPTNFVVSKYTGEVSYIDEGEDSN